MGLAPGAVYAAEMTSERYEWSRSCLGACQWLDVILGDTNGERTVLGSYCLCLSCCFSLLPPSVLPFCFEYRDLLQLNFSCMLS